MPYAIVEIQTFPQNRLQTKGEQFKPFPSLNTEKIRLNYKSETKNLFTTVLPYAIVEIHTFPQNRLQTKGDRSTQKKFDLITNQKPKIYSLLFCHTQ
ncbi:MAG: hypothetical protein F6K18_16595 [Okeania sp. SIO2C2]|uniref:hypothetical protein n=1 Tax=Okeania sp. SIO2C2 TaxID=2607787 RepID=UPI0013B8283C|nr:hypothetical protein [Okeania sp. SIO2C2]NEP88316.1 hypothetical protein [Okeania sp. SIO2C2]